MKINIKTNAIPMSESVEFICSSENSFNESYSFCFSIYIWSKNNNTLASVSSLWTGNTPWSF